MRVLLLHIVEEVNELVVWLRVEVEQNVNLAAQFFETLN